jgi:predicted DNA-binding antitoxin AbrB/MazE fold protein
LRNIINELKKSKEIAEFRSETKRIFFCLQKYCKKCKELEKRFKGKQVMLKDGSKVKVYQKSSKSSERTRKRLEKQKQKRQAKTYTKMKSRAKKNTRPHKS